MTVIGGILVKQGSGRLICHWAFCHRLGKTACNDGVIIAKKVKLSLSLIHTFVLNPTDCMQKNKRWKNAIKDGGSTTMHSKAKGGKKDGLDLKTFFFFGFREFLENFQEILNSREFSRNFTSRSRSRGIFISLFTSRKEWIRFSFHFSLLEKS